jgi:kinetochore protein Nuf2
MAPTYSFPILGNHEILACLGELDIPHTEQDLLKPHADTLYVAYEELVILLCGESRETMYAPELEAVDVLEFPELYEEAIGNLKFTRRLFHLMRRCGVPDFTLRDLTKPEYTRTRRNLSAVINFAKFREEKVAEYEDTQGESVEMEQRYFAAQRRNADLKAQILKIERAEKAENETEEETRDAIARLKIQHADAKRRADIAAAKKAAAQAELDALHAECDESTALLVAAESEKAELEQKILNVDPALTSALKDLTEKCEAARMKLDEATAETRVLETKAEFMKDLTKDIQKTTEYMEEIVSAWRKKKEASTKLKEAKKKFERLEEKQYEIEARVESLKRQEMNCQEKLNRLKSQGELKRHAAEASLKAAKEELEAVKARKAANSARTAEETNQLQTMQLKIDAMKRQHVSEVESLLNNFVSLREQVASYHAQLADAMDVPLKERVPLAQIGDGAGHRDPVTGEFTHTYNWTNYDTVHFGGIGKGGKPIQASGAARD